MGDFGAALLQQEKNQVFVMSLSELLLLLWMVGGTLVLGYTIRRFNKGLSIVDGVCVLVVGPFIGWAVLVIVGILWLDDLDGNHWLVRKRW